MTNGFRISWDGLHIVPDPARSEMDFRFVGQDVVGDPSAGSDVTHTARTYQNDLLRVACHERVFTGSGVREVWATAEAAGTTPVLIRRFDSFNIAAPASHRRLLYFSSEWGREFQPVRVSLESDFTVENRRGRSSGSFHPWFCLSGGDGAGMGIALAWSGNWIIRFNRNGDGYLVSGGLNDWEFSKLIGPGDRFEGVHAILAEGADLDDIANRFISWGRAHWYPGNVAARVLPVEWNHWWPYEDKDIDESTFLRNVDSAAEMGVEACTLDAGWFGASDGSTHWYEQRGDWDLVNTQRFPRGIRVLSDHTHQRGLKFGIWCEIESLGVKARLRAENPRLEALRAGSYMGYVCFGCPQTRAWAAETLERLIVDYGADWIKLDFNLDPGAGCNRTDHGHQAGDGLYEHYCGYYEVLSQLRSRHPKVMLENCSSGGLRIDLGVMRHTHATYLSDPDWPEHDLQLFWAATLMLAPERCLHWPWSQTRRDAAGRSPYPGLDLAGMDARIEPWRLAYYMRIGMLGWYGYSHKLPDLKEPVRRLLAEHAEFYRTRVRRFVANAALYRLTGQPLRGVGGDRWCAFQYLMPGAAEALVFVFRLPGAEPTRVLRLRGLLPAARYRIQDYDGGAPLSEAGVELAQKGLVVSNVREEESRVFSIIQS